MISTGLYTLHQPKWNILWLSPVLPVFNRFEDRPKWWVCYVSSGWLNQINTFFSYINHKTVKMSPWEHKQMKLFSEKDYKEVVEQSWNSVLTNGFRICSNNLWILNRLNFDWRTKMSVGPIVNKCKTLTKNVCFKIQIFSIRHGFEPKTLWL